MTEITKADELDLEESRDLVRRYRALLACSSYSPRRRLFQAPRECFIECDLVEELVEAFGQIMPSIVPFKIPDGSEHDGPTGTAA